MAKFYGQVKGQAETVAGRRGSQDIRVSAQSWDGSVITRLVYEDGTLKVQIEISDDSSLYGQSYFYGTLDELKKALKGGE